MSRYLLEVGTEAIPAGYMAPVLTLLHERAVSGLAALRLPVGHVVVRGTCKRMVLELHGLAARQEDETREVSGPRADIAFKDGVATPAAIGFARKNGVELDALERTTTDKGEFLLARVHEVGKPLVEVLPEFVTALIAELPWPKTMVYNSTGFRFPRPLRWMVSLLDDTVLPITLGGVQAGRLTQGHRMVAPGMHAVASASAYEMAVDKVGILLDPADRSSKISAELADEAKRLGGKCLLDDRLLEEVVFLAEHPTVYSGSFDPEFLALPREIVVTAMKAHQRYFAVESSSGELLPHFLVVCDGRWDDPSLVIAGNERVLRARLADARFYWDVDRRSGMDALAASLGNVVWLEAVGTLKQKAERVGWLVEHLGEVLHAGDWASMKTSMLRAAAIAKADLASEMIKDGKEFTGLQGIMGARYAAEAGEDPAVIRALEEQYLPQGASDRLPPSREGTLLSLADKFDTIAGCWAAGFVPSGSQDPYALRRAANGIVRILLDKSLRLSLRDVVGRAVRQLPDAARKEGLEGEILDFFRDRVAFALRERGIAYDTVDSVLATGVDDPWVAQMRAKALDTIRGDEDLARLVVGFKRAANILKGVDTDALPEAGALEWSGAEPAEQALHTAVAAASTTLNEARALGDFGRSLQAYLSLRDPIDQFFDAVMVMSDNPEERDRRLALLAEVRALFQPAFDPSRIVLEGEGA